MQLVVRAVWAWIVGAALVALVAAGLSGPAAAATTGTISGTVVDAASKAPIAGVTVTATAPSGRASAVTDAKGFYNLAGLAPDTYAVTFAKSGYQSSVTSGVTVFQDQVYSFDFGLSRGLQTIGGTRSRGGSNLVQPNQTADVYVVSAQQLGAAAGVGGHRTLYDVIQTTAGVTSTGVAARPRIRGSDVGDVAWEYDGIPINDRLTGLFTTNLSIVGTQNLEVFTGGYNAQYGNAAAGVINSVVKRGTNPGFGSITYTSQVPGAEHDVVLEYGGATPNNRFSWYLSLDSSNSDPVFANGYQPFIDSQALTARDSTGSTVYTRDAVANFHYKPTDRDDIQFLAQTGNQKLPFNKGLYDASGILAIAPCQGVVISGGAITNPGTSSTGQPCQVPVVTTVNNVPTITGLKNTGLQYYHTTQQQANVWYHYSNLGKIQWNHVFSDKLFAQFRIAENYNDYIFDQPFSLATINGVTTPGVPFLYAPVGTKNPGRVTGTAPNGTPAGPGNGYQDEYSVRRSQMYIANLDLTFTPSAHATYYFGLGYERDNSAQRYYDNCGCDEASGGVGGFNLDGSWPNLFLQVDYPLTLPSAYLGTKQTFGKLTLEPSLRYDEETYHLPNRPDVTNATTGAVTKSYAYGPYSTHAWSPRFAASWAAGAYDAFRASYGVTTTFVPAAYLFNDSPNGVAAGNSRVNSPYYPGSNISNQRNYNADFSYEHALRNGVDSFRITPFYRHAVDKLELSKNYTVDPATGTVTLAGASYFRTGIQNKATGVELGWNHVVRGDGLSSYLAATYVNYWGSLTPASLNSSTPYGGITSGSFAGQNAALRQFLATGQLFRNPSQPPWTVSWTGDLRYGRFHADPFVIYQVGAPYNVTGNTCLDQGYAPIGTPVTVPNPTKAQTPCPSALNDYAMHFARGNAWVSLDFGYDVVKTRARTVTLGMNVRNLLGQDFADVYPGVNTAYPKGNNPDLNTYGPSSVPNTLYYYAPNQQPRQLQFYVQTKF